MSHLQVVIFSVVLGLLIFLAGFFSLAETGLMAVNRYRLRHKARLKKRYAMLILKLLKRPDRLLGMILIGNNLANIIASALATLLALHFLGESGVVVSTILLALVVLIFAEVAPKTVAVLYADQVSKFVAWPVYIMLIIFYPLVWFVNLIANAVLRLFRIKVSHGNQEALSREELVSMVYDTAGKVSRQYQSMLLGVLDLNKITIDDVMVPQHEIIGVDMDQSWEEIQKRLAMSPHDWLPCYRENINQVIGLLHLREVTAALIAGQNVNKDFLLNLLKEPYFIPEGTPLNIQLANFQRQRKRMALIVDEYGEMRGLITLEDILEEIVGEFTTNVGASAKVSSQMDGSYLVSGAVTVRELNRMMQGHFPTKGPRTLNGIIIEYLEAMPRVGTCVRIAGYPIEIVDVKENRVYLARIFPRVSE